MSNILYRVDTKHGKEIMRVKTFNCADDMTRFTKKQDGNKWVVRNLVDGFKYGIPTKSGSYSFHDGQWCKIKE